MTEDVNFKQRGREHKHQETFQNFDRLPNSAYVRQPVVQLLISGSASAVWRAIAAGKLPRPHKVGLGINGWRVGELRQALGLSQ